MLIINLFFFIFRYDENNVPIDIRLLDLQSTTVGSPGLDLNYLLLNSVDGVLRRKSLNNFLSIYYSSFSIIFIINDKSPPYSCEDIKKEYRNKNKYGLLMSMMAIPLMYAEEDDAIDFSKITDETFDMANRVQQENSFKNPNIKLRFLDVIDEMVHNGVLKGSLK